MSGQKTAQPDPDAPYNPPAQQDIAKHTLSQARTASVKISGAMARAEQLKVRLDLGEQTANIQSMLNRYDASSVNSKVAAVDKYEQAAQSRLDGYTSAAQVAKDRGLAETDEEETPATDPELADLLTDIKGKRTASNSTP